MNISDQANLLLDDAAVRERKKRLDLFQTMEATILASVAPAKAVEERAVLVEESEKSSYIVASRLGRANYEDNAKREAIMSDLQKIRTNNRSTGSGRVIRST